MVITEDVTVNRETLKEIVLEILTDLSAGPAGDVELTLDDDYIQVDNVGLVGVAEFFGNIASLVVYLDAELENLDYKISTHNAYLLLASIIEYGIESGDLPRRGWEAVAERFLFRAQDFIGVKDALDIGDVWEEESAWADILSYIVFNWKLKTAEYGRDEFTNDERVLFIRSTLLGCRTKGWLNYRQPWAKTFIAALQEDWVYFGGGFGSGMGTGTNPWSHADPSW